MGYGRWWVNGKFIGDCHDLIYLSGYLLHTLYELKSSSELPEPLRNLDKESLFDRLYNRDRDLTEHLDNHIVGGSTFTDQFFIYSYIQGDSIYMIWKIVPNHQNSFLSGYPSDIFRESVSKDYFNQIVDEFKISIDSLVNNQQTSP